MTLSGRLRGWAAKLRRDGVTLWFAVRHPGCPWPAKALGLLVVGYALSPIDLIPDFIPVLGWLDELILLPGLIWLAIRLLPPPLLAECRARADRWLAAGRNKPVSRAGAVLIVLLWLGVLFALWRWLVGPWLAGAG